MKQKDEIEQLFADTFSNEKVIVPVSVKTKIDARIAKKDFFIWKLFAILFTVMAITFAIWKFSNFSSNQINSKINIASSSKVESNKKTTVFHREEEKKDLLESSTKINQDNTVENSFHKKEAKTKGCTVYVENNQKRKESTATKLSNTSQSSQHKNFRTSIKKDIKTAKNKENELGEESFYPKNHFTKMKQLNVPPNFFKLNLLTLNLFTGHLKAEINYNSPSTKPIEINKKKEHNLLWEIGLFSGVYNSYNKNNEENLTKRWWNSQIGFETSLQAKIRFKPRLAVGFGVGYGRNKLSLSRESTAFTTDSIPGYWVDNPVGSPDSVYIAPTVDTTFYSITSKGDYSVSKIFIPIYFEFRQPLFKSFYLDVGVGTRLHFQSWKSKDSQLNPKLSKFNMDLTLRPQFTYLIQKFSVGIYGRLDYTPLGLSDWGSLRANSIRGGLGVCFSYRF